MNPIRNAVLAMSAYIPGERAKGGDVVKLNANENPYPPSPKAIEAMRAALERLPLYPETSGAGVREAAAEVYGVEAEQIMAANASDEMLRILFQACAGEGDEAVAFPPTFTFYETLAAVQDARVRQVELAEDYSLPELPDLSQAKLAFLPNPNAPSGTLFPETDIRRLIESAPQALVVIDEAYTDFTDAPSAIGLLKEYPNLVVVRTFSKSYSLAGLRVGLGFASAGIMQELHKVRDYYNLDCVAQAGATAALHDQAHFRDNIAKIVATRKWFTDALRPLCAHIWPSCANFVLARFNRMPAKELYQALKDRGILVRYFDAPRLRDCLRITIGTDKQMQTLLAAMRDICPD